MKKFTFLFCSAVFFGSSFAGNNCTVIIPGDHSPKHFKMDPRVKDDEYLHKTIIFKMKTQYSQNCKTNSVDNLLPLQDYLNSLGATNLSKIYPNHTAPREATNALGQKLVDLTLIYSFKYTSDVNLEKAINGMLSLGYFEYVEPWYVPKVHGVCVPNDPSIGNQYYLKGKVTGSINVNNTAWCTTNGSASVVVGIVDTGTEPTHPDLAANYIGGWDVVANNNDPTWNGNSSTTPSNHGCSTSGDACAVTNNGVGVASPGFNTKYKCYKIADGTGALVAAYAGIVMAADSGCTIISNSWGGSGGGSYGQDIINYAAINKNRLVLASAGNNGVEDLTYPSSYDNVYRVAASTNTDVRASFTSYGLDVDYSAPGNSIYSTADKSTGYSYASGTSMACPVSAGGAALIQAVKNYSVAFQIGERMKQTCDPMGSEPMYTAGKMGKGRIDIGNAVGAQAAESIVATPILVDDKNDEIFDPSETLYISAKFTNYLDPSSSSASATLSVVSGPVAVVSGNYTIGALNTLDTANNVSAPFTVTVNSNAGINATAKFKIHIADGSFTGDTYFTILINPDYVNIVNNDLHTTITSWGRIGYNNDGQVNGLGVEYENPSPNAMLYESSLMIGVSSTKVSDMFRAGTTGDTDFVRVNRAHIVSPTIVSDFDVDGSFNDSHSATNAPIPVTVHHSAYAWSTAPYRKFVIVKYVIQNTGGTTLSNLHVGIMSDWDVPNANSGEDKAGYDAPNKMGYVNWVNGPLWAATKLLTSSAAANCYVVDNVNGGNGGVDPNQGTPGFDISEKYTVLSTARNADGYGAGGGDVMNCVSSGPFTINAGDSVTVAFALIGGDNLADIQNSACQAQFKWDNTGPCATAVNEFTANNFTADIFPNPASTAVNITYNIAGAASASLTVINSLGEEVMTLNNLSASKNNLTVDVSKLPAGNYFCRFKANDAILTKKFNIVR